MVILVKPLNVDKSTNKSWKAKHVTGWLSHLFFGGVVLAKSPKS
jgi:hypothetical protein